MRPVLDVGVHKPGQTKSSRQAKTPTGLDAIGDRASALKCDFNYNSSVAEIGSAAGDVTTDFVIRSCLLDGHIWQEERQGSMLVNKELLTGRSHLTGGALEFVCRLFISCM